MKKLNENRIGLGGMNSDGPISRRYKSKYISGYESGGYSGQGDSTYSQRLGTAYSDDDCYSREDEEIEELNELAIQASLINLNSRNIIFQASGTDIISEGALIEMGKTALSDVVKNLLASGAVVITGGLPADTIVEIMYAIERTKTVLDIIDSLKQGSKIVSNFFSKMENIKLENNLDDIKNISMTVIAELAMVYDSVSDDASFAFNLSEIKDSSKSVDLIRKVKDIFNELREQMMVFAKSSISAIGDWISSFIPDDGGNVGTAIKTVLVGAIEKASGTPFTALKSTITALPSGFSEYALSESKLIKYLIDMCEKIADAVEEFSMKNGVIEKGVKGVTSLEKRYFDTLGDYTPLGKVYDMAGGSAQSIGDFIRGEDSTLGKIGKATFDPRYRASLKKKLVDFGFDGLPSYIRDEIIPMIPKAVDLYARMIVYLSSFASLIETLSSGELEKFVENFDPEKLTKKEKGNKNLRDTLDTGSDVFVDSLINKNPKNQKEVNEYSNLIEFYDNMLNEEEDSEDEEIEEASVVASLGGGPVTPLGTDSKGKTPSNKKRKEQLNYFGKSYGIK